MSVGRSTLSLLLDSRLPLWLHTWRLHQIVQSDDYQDPSPCDCHLDLIYMFVFAYITVSRIWNPSIAGHRIHGAGFYSAMLTSHEWAFLHWKTYLQTSIVFNLIIILLPSLPVFWKLSLEPKQKGLSERPLVKLYAGETDAAQIFLTCIFAIGFFITGIQLIRILIIDNLKIYGNSQVTIIRSTIKLSLGVRLYCSKESNSSLTERVIVCCVPTSGPLVMVVNLAPSAGLEIRNQVWSSR